MKKISSFDNPLVKYLVTLQKSKNRYDNKQFIVEGWHLVSSALEHNSVVSILIDEVQLGKYESLLPKDIDILLVNDKIIKRISQNNTPQPIIALCSMLDKKEIKAENILILDNLQDPSNLGAILRSCSAFNITQVLLSNNSVDVYNHKVISASQGAIFTVNTQYCELFDTINILKKDSYYIFGTFLNEDNSYTDLDKIKFKSKNVFIFGNEGQGISKELRPIIDENFIIKTTKNVESLNVAVSVAITIYCLFIFNILK